MNNAIRKMLDKYECKTLTDYIFALKEIFQQIALLGLYRSKFFEKSAFYGGTALRIFYGLNRFSEDLDFTLLKTETDFDLNEYSNYLKKEFSAYGFDITIDKKEKAIKSPIQSAFLKANTKNELLVIDIPKNLANEIPVGSQVKIKIEVDSNPPSSFDTEVKYLLNPVPFSVKLVKLPYMFAGKMHSILYRNWKNRVKGRDWYDLVWFISNYPELSLTHLKERMIQTKSIKEDEELTFTKLKEIYIEIVSRINIEQAKKDVFPFLKDPSVLDIWSKDFFISIFDQIKAIE